MKQSVQWALATKSENVYRSSNRFANSGRTRKQRESVRLVVPATFKRRPSRTAAGAWNLFTVTLCRISVGCLDDDNLRGALKAVRDEVAAWLGLDDRDRRVRFEYREQQCPRGYLGVRVTVDDVEDPDVETCKVLGASPVVLGPVTEPGLRGARGGGSLDGLPPRDVARRGGGSGAQPALRDGGGRDSHGPVHARAPRRARGAGAGTLARELPFERCFALYPWDAPGVVTELPEISGLTEPPARIVVEAPPGVRCVVARGGTARVEIARSIQLVRTRHRDAELGPMWLYVTEEERTRT